MNTLEIVAIIAALMSVGIGVLAIWLSIVFYRMSMQASEKTKEASRDISAGVQRLEKLFDTLYADTFSMVRDTVTDMRKQIWPEKPAEEKISKETEQKADSKAEHLKKEVYKKIDNTLKTRDEKVDNKIVALQEIVEKTISKSRKVEREARKETVREHIIKEIKLLGKGNFKANEIVFEISDFQLKIVLQELRQMRKEGIISWTDDILGPETIIDAGNILK